MGHSWSATYFNEKFAREGIEADYVLYPIEHVMLQPQLDGYSVTIPYKEQIIPLLHALDPVAREIGAVNVVKTYPQPTGYNTDWIGFVASIRPLLQPSDRQALILGTGGAAKAVRYGLHTLGIQSQFVSRTSRPGCITYDDIDNEVMSSHTIIVNATPVGMFPHVNQCPDIPYELLSNQHVLFDCIYNPLQTLFLTRGAEHHCRTMNGLKMLHIQAETAWEIWTMHDAECKMQNEKCRMKNDLI